MTAASPIVDPVAAFRELDSRRMSLLSTRVVPLDGGVAYFDDHYPERYISNLLIVEDAEVPPGLVVRAAEEILGGADLAHRRIRVRDDATGIRLAPSLRAQGYTDERVVVMLLRRPSDRRAAVPVEECRFDDVRDLMEQVYRRDLPADPDTATRFVEQHGGWDRILGTRRFVARVDGAAAGQCELYVIGPDAEVEYVDTLEEYRGRGIATAVVLAAIDAARADGARHVFICADADDWPKTLYERLGFDPIGREWEFTHHPTT